MDEDDESRYQFERFEDLEIDRKIEKTKSLLRNFSLPDGGQKLKIFLNKLYQERERRNQSRLQKPNNSLCHQPDNNRISSASSLGHKSGHASGCNKSTGNDQQYGFKCSRQNRDHEFSLVQEDSSYRHTNCITAKDEHSSLVSSQKSKRRRFSSFVREENGCSQLAAKRRSSLSLTPQCLTKKKIATLVVLDEDDDEQPKQQQNPRMSEGWMKDMKIYYPARDHPESVEICYFDMECLAPFSYLSSPIMNFYIQYLQRPEYLTTEQRRDYHFFNTYFYNKIDEALYDKRRQENGCSFAKLRRWLKGVNIFEKAYIFLPIHYGLHWSLAIICIPMREDEVGPIILHLDSLGVHTSSIIFQKIRSYLKVEWEHLNQSEVPTHVPIAENTWKTLINKIENKRIQVPQQENEYDCGLFVLFFMERFIEEAPPRLRKTDLDRFGRKWFLPAEASHLRDSIKSLLQERFKHNNNSSPVICEDLTEN